ncbi:DNA-(apurinic or apyrimidinic site) lyase [Cladochytrium tenue]|nr:DNA-(apurinic or apyrimidinic site) lyase [Cladochytrium tenue]
MAPTRRGARRTTAAATTAEAAAEVEHEPAATTPAEGGGGGRGGRRAVARSIKKPAADTADAAEPVKAGRKKTAKRTADEDDEGEEEDREAAAEDEAKAKRPKKSPASPAAPTRRGRRGKAAAVSEPDVPDSPDELPEEPAASAKPASATVTAAATTVGVDDDSDFVEPASKPTNKTMPEKYSLADPANGAAAGEAGAVVKICSWNVAGVQAALKKGLVDYVRAENPDVLCLQETKTAGEPKEGLLKDLYPHQFWTSPPTGEKKGRYYGGVAVLSKVRPISWTGGIGVPEDDEGRAVVAEFESLHLIHTYVPNASTKLVRLPEKQRYNSAMEALMKRLDATGKPVVWCGDLNVAHDAIDLNNPKGNVRNAGFTVEERGDFSRILSGGATSTPGPAAVASAVGAAAPFVDVWRQLHPRVRDYSYFGYRQNCRERYAGWRLDYFVASRRLVEQVRGCVMRTDAYGAADHVPLVLALARVRL